jgi:hypothetical protein
MGERSKPDRMFVRLRLFECRELAQAVVLTPGPLFNDNRVQLAIGANAARPRRRRD